MEDLAETALFSLQHLETSISVRKASMELMHILSIEDAIKNEQNIKTKTQKLQWVLRWFVSHWYPYGIFIPDAVCFRALCPQSEIYINKLLYQFKMDSYLLISGYIKANTVRLLF